MDKGVTDLEYCLEMCSTYEHHRIREKDIYLFDSHNMALPVWGTYSVKLQAPLNLVTFDAHADTRPPFNRFVTNECADIGDDFMSHPSIRNILRNTHYRRDDFRFEDVWRISMSELANDEHICTAVDWGYLGSYTVICDLSVDDIEFYQNDDVRRGLKACYIQRDDWGRNATSIIGQFVNLPLALDFDLDYFHCIDDLNGEYWNSVAPLVKKSKVITIAREPNYFEALKNNARLTNQNAQEILLQKIQRILESM